MSLNGKNNVLKLGRTPIHTVMILAWPAILEQIMLTMVQYVDTAMIGVTGAQATAAVGVTSSTMWLIGGLFSAFSVGFSVPVAQAIGGGDYDRLRRAIRQAVLSVLAFGTLVTLVCQLIAPSLPRLLGADEAIHADATAYFRIITSVMVMQMASNVFSAILRCTGDMKTPMILNTSTNILNAILNALFIFEPSQHETIFGTLTLPGLGLGVRGAALASAISMGMIGILISAAVFRLRGPDGMRYTQIRGQNWRPDRAIWSEAVHNGLPVAFERATVSFGQVMFTSMVSRLGTIALAAHTLAITAESISYMPASGVSSAATTLVGQAKGAQLREEAERFGRLCSIMGVIIMSVMGVGLFAFAPWMLSLFTRDAAVIALGGRVLRLEAFAQPFFGAEMTLAGAMRGGGDSKFQFYVGLLGVWAVRLPIAAVLAFGFDMGLFGIWCGMVADLVVRGVLNVLRFRSGRWYGKTAA